MRNLEKVSETDAAQPEASAEARVSPARFWAWKLLQRIEKDAAYLDRVVEATLRQVSMSPPDRALLMELTHGVIRWRAYLDFLLQSCSQHPLRRYPLPVLTALRLGAYQLLFLERVPEYAAVHQSVELVKPLGRETAGLVNAILRALLRRRSHLPEPDAADPVRYHAIVQSYPEWLVRRWFARFGPQEAVQLLQVQNRRPKTTLRVNRQRIQPAELLQWLGSHGVVATPSPYVPHCIVAEQLPYELLQALLQHGWASVQDVSAVLVVELAAVQPGHHIVDLCGAPGGKACAMAERLQGSGHITVVDIHPNRLRLVAREAQRLGVASVLSLRAADARTVRCEPADVVVLDAPCSGLGTLAKKPDIKWRRRERDIYELASLQRQLLENAARLVRPGGVLIYSTCTTEPEENDAVVNDFLQQHPEFQLEPADQRLPAVVCREGFLQTLPHRHQDCDGAFAARLRRMA